MNKILIHVTILLTIVTGLSFFTSCEQDEISRISFDKATIALQVGKSDSLTSTIIYVGNLDKFSIEWIVEDASIISFEEVETNNSNAAANNNSLTKTIVLKALKAGKTSISISVDGKTHTCEVTVSQQVFTFTQAFAFNYGDYYDIETNNFEMYLLENTLFINDSGYIDGDGSLMFLELFLPLTHSTLSSTDFTAANDGTMNTFLQGETIIHDDKTYIGGSRLTSYQGDHAFHTLIKNGGFSIYKSGNNFVIEGDLILEDDEIIQFSFEGTITESDERHPEDLNPDLTQGLLMYFGDLYGSEAKNAPEPSNSFIAFLLSDNKSDNDTIWEGDMLLLQFNTSLSVTDYIPDGKYDVIKNLTYNDLRPFTVLPGYYDDTGDIWGTWFLGEKSTNKIKTGYMDVIKSDSIYTIDYELFDRFGSKVEGTYTGTLKYIDGTKEEDTDSPSKVKRINAVRELDLKNVKKPLYGIKKTPGWRIYTK